MNRWSTTFTIGVAVVLLSGGCTARSEERSQQASSPGPTVAESAPLTPGVSPWRRLALMGLEVEHYDSLKPMVGQSNVAIVGTVTSAEFTRKFVESDGEETMVDRMLQVQVSVERVLHGRVVDGADEVGIEFGPFDERDATDDLWAPLIGRRSVFVLRRLGAPVNLDPRRPEQLAWKVYRMVCSQGLLDDSDGVTTVPMADILVPFLKELTGQPFDDTVAAVAAVG